LQRQQCNSLLPERHRLTGARMAITIFYFPAEPMEGDIDNIVKPILDSLIGHFYHDDHQVERVLCSQGAFGRGSRSWTFARMGRVRSVIAEIGS
jgi:hypothetical protein